MMISAESPKDGETVATVETVAVPAAQSLEPFFTPGQGAVYGEGMTGDREGWTSLTSFSGT